MFSDAFLLFTEISKVDFNISYKVKIGFLIFILTIISVLFYTFKDTLDKSIFRDSYQWYYFITFINFLNIMVIYYYYNYKEQQVGLPGQIGKKGIKGERGKFKNCAFCKHNLYVQKTNKYDTICKVLKSTKMTDFRDNMGKLTFTRLFDYFDNNNIDYGAIVNNGLLQKPINYEFVNQEYHNYFKLINDIIYDDSTIIEMFAYFINKDNASNKGNTFGTIIRPVAKYGYNLFGDSIKGAEEDFKMNAFLVSGGGSSDLMYPKKINPIVTFNVYDLDLKKNKAYQIWRGESREERMYPDIESGSGSQLTKKYHSLGDVVLPSGAEPEEYLMSAIDETCLKTVDSDSLEMMFLYSDSNYKSIVGRLNSNQKLELKKEFQIEKPASMLNMFSVWRTPMNTMIVSYVNESTPFYNNTVAYNLIEGRIDMLDDFGNVTIKTRRNIISRLKKVKLNVLQVIIILIHHHNVQLTNKFTYYLKKNMSKFDEIAKIEIENIVNNSNSSLSRIINFIDTTEERYEEDNVQRAKDIYDLSESRNSASEGVSSDTIGTDFINKRKEIPNAIKNLYQEVENKKYAISKQAYDITNMYQLLLAVYPNGLKERIAIDNEGLAEGGEILNYAQEWVFYICKVLLPPIKQVYQLKNDCIGTMKIDNKRNILEKNLEKQIRKYKNLMKTYRRNGNKYCANWSLVTKFQDLSFKVIAEHVGHIENYQSKINNYKFEEFTNTRLKVILEEYYKMNDYILQDCRELETDINNIR